MTKRYEVIGTSVSFSPGIVLGLTDAQARSRLTHLQKRGGGRYTVTAPVEFKRGEILRVEAEVPKILSGKLQELPEKKEEVPSSSGLILRHKGSGRYEVINGRGHVLTQKLLKKQEAQDFIDSYQGGEKA